MGVYCYECSNTENIGFEKKTKQKQIEENKQTRKPNSRKNKKTTRQQDKQEQTTEENAGLICFCFFPVFFFAGDSSCRVVFLVIRFLIVCVCFF